MYYHPLIWPSFTSERALKACRSIANIWFDGVERHRVVQTDAVRTFRNDQVRNSRTLSEAQDGTQFVIRLLSFAAVEPLRLVALASELGGVAIDTHRQTLNVLREHNEQLTIQPAAEAADEKQPRSDDRRGRSRKLQMVG